MLTITIHDPLDTAETRDYLAERELEFTKFPPYANHAILNWGSRVDTDTYKRIIESKAFSEVMVFVNSQVIPLLGFGQDPFKNRFSKEIEAFIRQNTLGIAEKHSIKPIDLAQSLCAYSNLLHQYEDWNWDTYTYVGVLCCMDEEDLVDTAKAA